jgi:hypothetical protein
LLEGFHHGDKRFDSSTPWTFQKQLFNPFVAQKNKVAYQEQLTCQQCSTWNTHRVRQSRLDGTRLQLERLLLKDDVEDCANSSVGNLVGERLMRSEVAHICFGDVPRGTPRNGPSSPHWDLDSVQDSIQLTSGAEECSSRNTRLERMRTAATWSSQRPQKQLYPRRVPWEMFHVEHSC